MNTLSGRYARATEQPERRTHRLENERQSRRMRREDGVHPVQEGFFMNLTSFEGFDGDNFRLADQTVVGSELLAAEITYVLRIIDIIGEYCF